MLHLLDIDFLSNSLINDLIQRALQFKHKAKYPSYPHSMVANLFYENSTRTRMSFEVAAKRLSMHVLNIDLSMSSENKGEIVEDTLQNLAAMGIQFFVIRHRLERMPMQLAERCGEKVHIINAGDGINAHPSQALLDVMTIVENKLRLDEIKVAIVGDIRHSRVANSLQKIFQRLNLAELALVAPVKWQPDTVHYGYVTDSLHSGLKDADVVICLRVQRERLLPDEGLDLTSYHRNYALTRDTVRYAKNNAMILHPGPINRGIEMDNDIADGNQSFILSQVTNGVFVRMAIFEALSLGLNTLPNKV